MARAIREYQIRPMVCDWALDIPMGNTTFVLHFNSRNNAELVKAILEWEDSHPNEAIPYQPTLTPPNEALTMEELQEMDGEPVWIVEQPDWGHWELSADAEDYLANRDQDFYGLKHDDPAGRYGLHVLGWLAYRRPPEGEEERHGD